MKLKRALLAVSFAAAASSSCHFQPLAERHYWGELRNRMQSEYAENMRALNKKVDVTSPPRRFSCDGGLVLPGGIKTDAFVFLQYHFDNVSQKLPYQSAQSQLLIYRVLQDLIKKYGIRTVILEGYEQNRLYQHYYQSAEKKEEIASVRVSFERCARKVSSLAGKAVPGLQKKEAEDICLMSFFAIGDPEAHWKLLLTETPGTRITGFEIHDRTYKEVMEHLSRLTRTALELDGKAPGRAAPERQGTILYWLSIDRVRALLEESKKKDEGPNFLDVLLDPAVAPGISPELAKKRIAEYCGDSPRCRRMAPLTEEKFMFWHKYGEYIMRTRSSHAVKSILLHASHNSALVIGADHMRTMAFELGKIPHRYRPTVHFLESECTNKSAHATPTERMLDVVNVLSEKH